MVNLLPHSPDLIVIYAAVGSFLFFLILHLVFFRFVSHPHVPRWLKRFALLTVTVNILICVIALKDFVLSGPAIVVCSIVSVAIMVFLTMIYILGWFGLLESAIRMRLMWELDKVHPRPLSLAELTADYNAETILNARLGRLTATQEITFDGKNYYPGDQMSFFVFKEWIGLQIISLLKGKPH